MVSAVPDTGHAILGRLTPLVAGLGSQSAATLTSGNLRAARDRAASTG